MSDRTFKNLEATPLPVLKVGLVEIFSGRGRFEDQDFLKRAFLACFICVNRPYGFDRVRVSQYSHGYLEALQRDETMTHVLPVFDGHQVPGEQLVACLEQGLPFVTFEARFGGGSERHEDEPDRVWFKLVLPDGRVRRTGEYIEKSRATADLLSGGLGGEFKFQAMPTHGSGCALYPAARAA
jgi:hypothetical protein